MFRFVSNVVFLAYPLSFNLFFLFSSPCVRSLTTELLLTFASSRHFIYQGGGQDWRFFVIIFIVKDHFLLGGVPSTQDVNTPSQDCSSSPDNSPRPTAPKGGGQLAPQRLLTTDWGEWINKTTDFNAADQRLFEWIFSYPWSQFFLDPSHMLIAVSMTTSALTPLQSSNFNLPMSRFQWRH